MRTEFKTIVGIERMPFHKRDKPQNGLNEDFAAAVQLGIIFNSGSYSPTSSSRYNSFTAR